MRRPLFVLAIALVTLGSVQALSMFQASLPPAPSFQGIEALATGAFTLDITPTFDCQRDAFGQDPTSVLVRLQTRDLLRREEACPAGIPLKIPDVTGVAVGKNSFYVRLSAADESWDVERAARIRVYRDGALVAEKTIWSAPGEPVEGVMEIEVQ